MLRKVHLIIVAVLTGMILFIPSMALASPAQEAICQGAGGTWNGGTGTCTAPGPNAPSIVIKAVRLFSVVIGVIAVVMVMISGVKYMTSQGDANAVASAKNTLLYALVGIVVAALAQGIVKYVLNRAS